MSSLRWDPVNDLVSLREAMNNLLEESFVRPQRGGAPNAPAGLALDVEETPDAFRVTASVPGVGAEDIAITVLLDTLRIHGARREPREAAADSGRWLIRERRFGAFERAVTLPAAVRSDAVTADFRDGVLTVTLPKAEETKARSIPVRSGVAAAATATIQPREIEIESRSPVETVGS